MPVTSGNGVTVLILNIAKPVSVNHYLTRTVRGVTLSAEALIFKRTLTEAVANALVSEGVRNLLYDKDGKKSVTVTMSVWMAVHRTTDLANLDKLLSDTFNELLWRDDNQVDALQMYRVPVGKNNPERLTVYLQVHQAEHIPPIPTTADIVIDASQHHVIYTEQTALVRERRKATRERKRNRQSTNSKEEGTAPKNRSRKSGNKA
jgi:Holliday junction resolvase RusA-like endonuclease